MKTYPFRDLPRPPRPFHRQYQFDQMRDVIDARERTGWTGNVFGKADVAPASSREYWDWVQQNRLNLRATVCSLIGHTGSFKSVCERCGEILSETLKRAIAELKKPKPL